MGKGYSVEGEQKTVAELIEKVCEDICDNYCEYRHTSDENAECEILRCGKECPLDRLR